MLHILLQDVASTVGAVGLGAAEKIFNFES